MPVTKGGTIDPAATREKVLRCAADLFARSGVHAVGVQEIAEQAGASKLTIYRYFGSKEGLVEAVVRKRSASTMVQLRARVGGTSRDAEKILSVFEELTTIYRRDHFRGCPVINTAMETRGTNNVARDLARGHLIRYRELFEELLGELGVERPSTLARQLVTLVEGATTISAIDGHEQAALDAKTAAKVLLSAAMDRK